MAIDISQYVDITSGVGVGTLVADRELILRIFSINPLIPPQLPALEFQSASDVGNYFGTSSQEYARALFYFGWVSKNITRPKKISFARWVNTDVAPAIYGNNIALPTLTQWQAITNGSFGLTISGTAHTFTGLDFSGASSLSDVASIIQAAINLETGTMWTSAIVLYNSTRGSFDFVGGSAIAATISVQEGSTGTHIAATMGWLAGVNLIIAYGAIEQTITQALDSSSNASNNFGSFIFIPSLTLDEITEASAWNTNQNILYQYYVPVDMSTYSSYSAALINYSGVGLILSLTSGEYPEQAPSMIMAATDYTQPNSVQNYMFQQFNLTPSVTDTTTSRALDLARINYYGQTQQAGQLLSFFQRGVLMGLPSSPLDMNVYANEQWLKDAATSAFMTLLLILTKVSANTQGRGQVLSILQSVINLALLNGTISVGKTLSTFQQLYITELSNDSKAWYQVQNIGYWVNCVIKQEELVPNSGVLEYVLAYTLIYSKDDDIRKIAGTHVLI